jgi:RNA polymerase sigma factor FliA
MHPDGEDIAMLWKCYTYSRSVRLRNMLVEHYRYLVEIIARKLIKRLHDVVDLDDLVSVGTLGLIRAVERFDPGHGVYFRTFASLRIHGAMLDDLRQSDWLPRGARHRVKQWNETADLLAVTTGHRPSEDEVAAVLNMEPQQNRQERGAGAARSYSITSLTENEEELGGEWESDEGRDDPGRTTPIQDEVEHLLARLPEKHRRLIRLRYLDGLTFPEMAKLLGRSPMTACGNTHFAMTKLKQIAA